MTPEEEQVITWLLGVVVVFASCYLFLGLLQPRDWFIGALRWFFFVWSLLGVLIVLLILIYNHVGAVL